MFSKVLIFQGFRGFGDCSPWRLECLFLIRKGRFLISFSNCGGRTFSHMPILTLLSKGVGVTEKPSHFRTLFPFSVSGKTIVGLLLRRAEKRSPCESSKVPRRPAAAGFPTIVSVRI